MGLLTEQGVRDCITFETQEDMSMNALILRGVFTTYSQVLITHEELSSAINAQMIMDFEREAVTKQIIRMVHTAELEQELQRLRELEAACYNCAHCAEQQKYFTFTLRR